MQNCSSNFVRYFLLYNASDRLFILYANFNNNYVCSYMYSNIIKKYLQSYLQQQIILVFLYA